MKIIKETHPVARKKHYCDLCGGFIMPGTRYKSQTNDYGGEIGNCKCHEECVEVADRLDMCAQCYYDDGLTAEYFLDCINDYRKDNKKDWDKLEIFEQVKLILKELKDGK